MPRPNPTTILAIETSTNACSVAVSKSGSLVAESMEVGQSIHSRQLLDMIDGLIKQESLSREDLDAVAVGKGPGSFTGLRIGIGVAQGLAYSLKLPMIGVTSLQAMVDTDDLAEGYVLAAIDARMSEVYWSLCSLKNQIISQIGEIQLSAPEDIDIGILGVDLPKRDRLVKIGNAWQAYPGRFSDQIESYDQNHDYIYPRARTLLKHAEKVYQAGKHEDAAVFEPLYVRNDVAKKTNKSLIK